MTKQQSKHLKIPAWLKGQRPPAARWLWLPRFRCWQRNTKPVSSGDWLAYDVGLFVDPKKRAIWEAAGGPAAAVAYQGLVALVGGDGDGHQTGLIWGDVEMLAARVPEIGQVGVEWMIEAGWAVYLTHKQAQVIRAGGGLDELLTAAAVPQQEMFEGLAHGLSVAWGEPDRSRKSEALYWKPWGNGQGQVRLALRKRRRSADTVCDLIVSGEPKHAEASDVAIPLDGTVSATALVHRIVAEVTGESGPNSGPKHSSPSGAVSEAKPHCDAENGDQPLDNQTVDMGAVSAEKGHYSGGNGDLDRSSGSKSHIQDKTGQNPRKQHRTAPEKTPPGHQSARANPGCERPNSTIPQNTTQDGTATAPATAPAAGTDAAQGREPGNPHEPEAGQGPGPAGSQSGPGGRDGQPHEPEVGDARTGRSGGRGGVPASFAAAIKLVWRDADAQKFGEEVFAILWPGRATGGDDAKSEIGSFGAVWIREVKAKLPSEAWPAARAKAIETARHVKAHHKGARRRGASFISTWRKRR